MKIVVFSDVHGNLPALEKMLKDAGHCDSYICLGDIVNYGPWSNECVELITSLKKCRILKGNHETYFLNKRYPGDNIIAKSFFDFCINSFTKQKLIDNLPDKYLFNNYCFIHTIDDQKVYPDSKIELDGNYVIGHSHHQFKIQQSPFTLYNAGSVGQNRLYINVINYLIYNTEVDTFEMRSVKYDQNLIIDEMKRRKYPGICIDYYSNKKTL